MKRTLLFILSVLFLFSCKKGSDLPLVETITSGSKWNLQTGSLPEDVYSQLQKLGEEKQFTDVAVAYRHPYSKPEDIKGNFSFYRALTLQSNTAYIERVLIQFRDDKVSSIHAGGAMLDSISQWPRDTPDESTIHNNDPVSGVYAKLLAIYQIPAYSKYQIILPDKSLEKPYDPDMAHYNEWGFTFSHEVKPGRTGTSNVTLYFSNGKLSKIRYEYNEADVYN